MPASRELFVQEDVIIRPYRDSDRATVREICCETADRGEPVENLCRDRELVADLVTRYYTDVEPQTSWVAEVDGRVAGYLTGALDTSACRRALTRRMAPAALWRAAGRGALWRGESWRWMGALIRSAPAWFARSSWRLDEYPAHLHINLLKSGRGRGIGRRLMNVCLDYLAARNVSGVHARVRGDNAPACAFFQRMGFRPLESRRIRLPSREEKRWVEVITYGRTMESRQPGRA